MRSKIRAFVLTAVLAIALAVVGSKAKAKEELEHFQAPGIFNYTRLTGAAGNAGPVVGFGGATKPAAMTWLKSQGFAAVVNLRLASEDGVDIDAERAAADAAGLTYIHLPFDAEKPDADLIANFTAAVENRANQPVYIHCHSATRAAGLWMIERVRRDGLSIDEARSEAKTIAEKPDEAIAFALSVLSK